MKDFDAKRSERRDTNREFRIGGESFIRVPGVRPEVLSAWESVDSTTPNDVALKTLDELMLAFIEPVEDGHERWVALRERREDPVTLEDMMEVVAWFISEATGRPTRSPSDSSAGRDAPGTTSTDASFSSDALEAQAV